MSKLVSVVTPCFNEEGNVNELYERIKNVFEELPGYDFEHIFIDNASSDKTCELVKKLASKDKRVKLIVNARNFGHIRSPFHGLLQASGDCAMLMVSDLQDPPELIKDFVKKWEEGHKIIVGVKEQSEETAIMFFVRSTYYRLVGKLSEIPLKKNYTGFGLYDKKIIEELKNINDPYPYFRGLVFELGFDPVEIIYKQPLRKRGLTSNNFYSLYDMGMLGIVSHSKVPLRIATISGFIFSIISMLISIGYLVAKLLYWDNIPFGVAPIVLGLFFFASVQLLFLGILGEYIGFIYTKVTNRPLVHEKERVNI